MNLTIVLHAVMATNAGEVLPPIDDVARAAARRFALVETLRVQSTAHWVYPKGSMTKEQAILGDLERRYAAQQRAKSPRDTALIKSKSTTELTPPVEQTVDTRRSLLWKKGIGSKISDATPQWSDSEGRSIPLPWHSSSFQGEYRKHNPVSLFGRPQQGAIRTADHNENVALDPGWTVLFSLLWHAESGCRFTPERFRVVGWHNADGTRLLKLQTESVQPQLTILVDAARDYVPVRVEVFGAPDRPDRRHIIQYAPHDVLGWVPSAAEITQFNPQDKQHPVRHVRTERVDRLELNTIVKDDELQLDFPPGTRVHQAARGDEPEKYVVVGSQGDFHLAGVFGGDVDWDVAQSNAEAGPGRRWLKRVAVPVALFIIIFGAVILRGRTRRTTHR